MPADRYDDLGFNPHTDLGFVPKKLTAPSGSDPTTNAANEALARSGLTVRPPNPVAGLPKSDDTLQRAASFPTGEEIQQSLAKKREQIIPTLGGTPIVNQDQNITGGVSSILPGVQRAGSGAAEGNVGEVAGGVSDLARSGMEVSSPFGLGSYIRKPIQTGLSLGAGIGAGHLAENYSQPYLGQGGSELLGTILGAGVGAAGMHPSTPFVLKGAGGNMGRSLVDPSMLNMHHPLSGLSKIATSPYAGAAYGKYMGAILPGGPEPWAAIGASVPLARAGIQGGLEGFRNYKRSLPIDLSGRAPLSGNLKVAPPPQESSPFIGPMEKPALPSGRQVGGFQESPPPPPPATRTPLWSGIKVNPPQEIPPLQSIPPQTGDFGIPQTPSGRPVGGRPIPPAPPPEVNPKLESLLQSLRDLVQRKNAPAPEPEIPQPSPIEIPQEQLPQTLQTSALQEPPETMTVGPPSPKESGEGTKPLQVNPPSQERLLSPRETTQGVLRRIMERAGEFHATDPEAAGKILESGEIKANPWLHKGLGKTKVKKLMAGKAQKGGWEQAEAIKNPETGLWDDVMHHSTLPDLAAVQDAKTGEWSLHSTNKLGESSFYSELGYPSGTLEQVGKDAKDYMGPLIADRGPSTSRVPRISPKAEKAISFELDPAKMPPTRPLVESGYGKTRQAAHYENPEMISQLQEIQNKIDDLHIQVQNNKIPINDFYDQINALDQEAANVRQATSYNVPNQQFEFENVTKKGKPIPTSAIKRVHIDRSALPKAQAGQPDKYTLFESQATPEQLETYDDIYSNEGNAAASKYVNEIVGKIRSPGTAEDIAESLRSKLPVNAPIDIHESGRAMHSSRVSRYKEELRQMKKQVEERRMKVNAPQVK